MSDNALAPETCFTLQIQLDNLNRAAERCRAGLHALRSGGLSRQDYARLFDEQCDAQLRWERTYREFVDTRPE